jgi:group I intron endonuclease
MVIYTITNTINKKVYVGQTTRAVECRWAKHCSKSTKSAIGCAIQKYGKDVFMFEVVYTAYSIEELNSKEIEYITKYNSTAPNGYNITKGGLNYEVTEELRKKMLDNWHTPNRKAVVDNIKTVNIGRRHTEETKARMAKTRLGFTHTEQTKELLRELNKGKTIPEIDAVKMALSRLVNGKGKGVRYKQKTEQYEAFINILGKSYSKVFSTKKLGHETAKQLAEAYRDELKKTAFNYYTDKITELSNG